MLTSRRDCPEKGIISLTPEFRKDLQWFKLYATSNNGVPMIAEDSRQPIDIFMDAWHCLHHQLQCIVPGSGIPHWFFLQHVLEEEWLICELEALNVAVAVKLWAPILVGERVYSYSDSSMAVAILQAGKGRNSYIQACAMMIWLACALHDITLMCTLTPGDSLLSTANALSKFHLDGLYIRAGYVRL